MKKYLYAAMMAFAVIALASCEDKNNEKKPEPGPEPEPTQEAGIFMYAYSLENCPDEGEIDWKKGDMDLMVVNIDTLGNQTTSCQLFITTADSAVDKIAGAYRLGGEGNSIYSYLYVDTVAYKIAGGSMMIECLGDTTVNSIQCPLYEILLFNCYTDTKQSINDIQFRIPAMFIDKAKFDAGKTADEWIIPAADKLLKTIEIVAPFYGGKDSTANQGWWNAMGIGEQYGVVLYGFASNFWSATPSSRLYIDGTNATVIFDANGKNPDTEIISGYGYNYYAGGSFILNYYLYGKDGNIYHAIIYYSANEAERKDPMLEKRLMMRR